MRSVFFLLLVLLIFPGRIFAQAAFQNESQSYKYDPYREAWFDYHVAESSDSFHIYLRLDFPGDINPDNDYHIYYELREGYADKPSGSITTLNVARDCLVHSYSSFIYYVSVPKSAGSQLLVFHVSKNGGYHDLFDIPLRRPSFFPYSDLVLYSPSTRAPVIRPYVHSGDSVYLESVNPRVHKLFIFRYPEVFDAADPPMFLLEKKVGKLLRYDSVMETETGRIFIFPGKGLYFIQSDTSGMAGLAIRCEEEHYPRLVLMDDVFEPIIYMSTREELQKLKQSDDKRQAFESYWLKITRSEDKARKIIRAYYQRVEEADNFFTTYKEGWKTDMGMIYLFFGHPDEVFNSGDSEKWFYSKSGEVPGVSFTFTRLSNVFSSRSYVLERSEDYKSQWYKRIDQWRRGLNF